MFCNVSFLFIKTQYGFIILLCMKYEAFRFHIALQSPITFWCITSDLIKWGIKSTNESQSLCRRHTHKCVFARCASQQTTRAFFFKSDIAAFVSKAKLIKSVCQAPRQQLALKHSVKRRKLPPGAVFDERFIICQEDAVVAPKTFWFVSHLKPNF